MTEHTLDAALGFGEHFAPALESSLLALASTWPVGERLRGAAVAEVAAQLRSALGVPIPAVLAAGWRGFDVCRALSAQPAGETETIEMAEHTVRWSAMPTVELALGEAPVAAVAFAVEVEIRVRAGVLVVEGGRFARLHAAALEIAATLALEGAPVAEWSRPLPVPGTLAFGEEGIPISPEPAPGAVGSTVSVPAIAN
jgi:hypothetical protein